MEEKMHLVEQAKGMSESAWAAKTDKLVQQYKREVNGIAPLLRGGSSIIFSQCMCSLIAKADDARAQADRRLQDLTAHQTRATDVRRVVQLSDCWWRYSLSR